MTPSTRKPNPHISLMSLNADFTAAAWAVGSLVLGGVTGALLDRVTTYTIEHKMHDYDHITRAMVRVALQGGVGVVALGSVVRAVIPEGTETPIGDAMLYFAFLHAQVNLLRDLHLVEHVVVHKFMGTLPGHASTHPATLAPKDEDSEDPPSAHSARPRTYSSLADQIK